MPPRTSGPGRRVGVEWWSGRCSGLALGAARRRTPALGRRLRVGARCLPGCVRRVACSLSPFAAWCIGEPRAPASCSRARGSSAVRRRKAPQAKREHRAIQDHGVSDVCRRWEKPVRAAERGTRQALRSLRPAPAAASGPGPAAFPSAVPPMPRPPAARTWSEQSHTCTGTGPPRANLANPGSRHMAQCKIPCTLVLLWSRSTTSRPRRRHPPNVRAGTRMMGGEAVE
jgi:hypothetical protein